MKQIQVFAEHIGLAAAEPEKLADWYEKLFGLHKVQKGNNGPYFLTEPSSGFMIEIFFCENPTENDSVHLCLRVQDIESAISLLPADIKEVTALRQQKDGSKVYFFKDPANHILQFVQR